ncbi:hypothetical protein PCANC_27858 [Puccinia coronata f. sp. avenae]|uniref:Uncharacterized protein n=1 Tax=Puccinia coronata f. sp. avenae TaxID=200324 RepID=A0A2N5TQE0_9BASI|nr:hypothetical protein PCANC_27858 [Puccinia coronata f. sp. avenae]
MRSLPPRSRPQSQFYCLSFTAGSHSHSSSPGHQTLTSLLVVEVYDLYNNQTITSTWAKLFVLIVSVMFVYSPGEEYFELITVCPYILWGSPSVAQCEWQPSSVGEVRWIWAYVRTVVIASFVGFDHSNPIFLRRCVFEERAAPSFFPFTDSALPVG